MIQHDNRAMMRIREQPLAALQRTTVMPTLTLNGQSVDFEGRPTILQVALEQGVELPHYCYHEGLSIVASCRICLAEVAAPNPRNENKVELMPKLVPTCQTPASDGMVVYTKSPKAIANQKAVMEFLLINHPLDCPVCDQAGECHLQDYSYQYGRAQSRFEEDKIKNTTKDIGPHVKLYADRCIMCSRCVRFTREVTGTGEIGVFGRGSAEEIDIFPGKPLDNELSGNVVDICPVGALLDKDFLFTQRVWFLKQTPSIDGLTASGDNIGIHHNQGRVYRIKPRRNLDVNQWWISDEIRYGWQFVHSEARLHEPKRMQLGTPETTTWQNAYDQACDGLKQAVKDNGDGVIALVVSPMQACEEAYLLGKLARGLDAKALLAVGPIPTGGQDKTFPGGYTVRAEKCPNARGVRRALEHVGDGVLTFDDCVATLAEKSSKIKAVIITGNYPSAWTTKDLAAGLRNKFVIAIDTLPNDVTAKADVLLPAATWVEKAGTFENADGRLQSFEQAIPPIEFTRAEGQIALDLAAACGLAHEQTYNAATVRDDMGVPFTTDVHHPDQHDVRTPDMQYVEL